MVRIHFGSEKFVGLVADNPDEKIKLKMFHAEIITDADKLNVEMKKYKDIPVVSNVTQQQVLKLVMWQKIVGDFD